MTLRSALKAFLIYLIISVSCFFMLRTMASYWPLQDTSAFLQFKQDYIHITHWKVAFYIHVFTSVFTLILGFFQFSKFFLMAYPKFHRWSGRLYAYNILLVNFPSGLVMAFYANGLLISQIAFVILDVLWFWFTLKGVLAIRKGDKRSHEAFMIRSYALTFSAITLRMWKMVLSSLFVIDTLTLYQIDSWLGFVPNLIVAELIIRSKKSVLIS